MNSALLLAAGIRDKNHDFLKKIIKILFFKFKSGLFDLNNIFLFL